jgi:hypothetical protein
VRRERYTPLCKKEEYEKKIKYKNSKTYKGNPLYYYTLPGDPHNKVLDIKTESGWTDYADHLFYKSYMKSRNYSMRYRLMLSTYEVDSYNYSWNIKKEL